MVFSSTIFLFLFLPIVLMGYYNPVCKGRTYRNIFLLLASLGFYAWGEPIFFFVMSISIVINWAFGLWIDRTNDAKRKGILTVFVIYNIGLLFVFKYLSFVTKNLGILLNNNDIVMQIALPIGISFFTFQIMSYVFDVYYKTVQVQKNVLNVALYVTMFPQLIAGPIVRYETVAYEIENRKETIDDFLHGAIRFVYGLGKKVLIANYVAIIADNVFAMQSGISVLTAWLGLISYTLQIYFDFSGYSDMAIGLGLMFGFHFEENFNYPYIARSITDFWRRWHISLSTWFRDYVYIPLGGNRVSKKKWIINLFIVWSLTGIWHGANWTFLLWGLFYYAVLLIEKLTNFPEKLKGFSHVYTIFVVMIAWVLFRAENVTKAIGYMGFLFGIGTSSMIDKVSINYLSNGAFVIALAALFSTPLYKKLLSFIKNEVVKTIIEDALVLVIFILSLLCCIKSTYNPFIYFNF